MASTVTNLEAGQTSADILGEIEGHFSGKVPRFFAALADVDDSLLRAKWADYRRTLFDGSSLLPKRLKYMMMYQTVKGHSQCHRCADMHRGMMIDMGIEPQLVKDLEADITRSGLIDERSKQVLVLTYHLASYHPIFNGELDEKLFGASLALLGERTTTEIVALISTCKSLQDFIHIRRLH